jgi:hypothetical protein
MVNGEIMICMALAYISGQTEGSSKVSTKMTKRMVSVYITGLMAGSMKAGGVRANSTVWEPISTQPRVR